MMMRARGGGSPQAGPRARRTSAATKSPPVLHRAPIHGGRACTTDPARRDDAIGVARREQLASAVVPSIACQPSPHRPRPARTPASEVCAAFLAATCERVSRCVCRPVEHPRPHRVIEHRGRAIIPGGIMSGRGVVLYFSSHRLHSNSKPKAVRKKVLCSCCSSSRH